MQLFSGIAYHLAEKLAEYRRVQAIEVEVIGYGDTAELPELQEGACLLCHCLLRRVNVSARIVRIHG